MEVKVGLFVFVGLVLLAVLLIQFSKGTSIFSGTYQVRMTAPNVGGLKLRASVLLAGVIVGDVSDIQLAPDGKSVAIILKIYKNVTIYSDAHFVIETAGFLGDQFVAVIPTQNQGPVLANGSQVDCEPPFDLQLIARSAAGFVQRTDDTVKKIEDSVSKLQKAVLNDQTLSNLSLTIDNLRVASDRIAGAAGNIDSLVATNSGQLSLAVSNVVLFSQQLDGVADGARNILATNGATISGAMTNLENTTATLQGIAEDMRAGKGLAGTVLENDELASNVQITVNNLAITSSNLNKLGLWHVLWRHDEARTNASPKGSRGTE